LHIKEVIPYALLIYTFIGSCNRLGNFVLHDLKHIDLVMNWLSYSLDKYVLGVSNTVMMMQCLNIIWLGHMIFRLDCSKSCFILESAECADFYIKI